MNSTAQGLRYAQAPAMRSLVISAVSKRSFQTLIWGQSMPHSCHGGCLDILLYRPLYTIGSREAYLNGLFAGGNNMYERRRVCQMWVFRALSMKAVATEKTSEEREAFSQDLPASLYKRISRIGARKRSAVAELEGWINEGKERPKKFELKRMVKELRKYSRHEHALEGFCRFSSG